jgi:KamA family protein
MLDDPALAELVRCLDRIAHVKRLRIHTRLPVVLPSRVTESLRDLLAGARPRLVMVIHANHANELGADSERALRHLTSSGIPILSQSVLLRGVNDSAGRLCALSERLFECGVLPYYLHQLDPVQGAAHFAVPDAEAIGLESSLRQRLPGYLVPRLVREIPGAGAKMPLIPKKAAFTQRRKDAKIFQAVSSVMPFT